MPVFQRPLIIKGLEFFNCLNHWIVRLVEYLNEGVLPPEFQARPTELIVGIEPDVLLLQNADHPDPKPPAVRQPELGQATSTAVLPLPAELPMVGIYSAYDTTRLVAAIELVSPGNKDCPEAVRGFVEKVIFLLQEGVHVMMVDVIRLPRLAIRQAILQRLGLSDGQNASQDSWLASYCALPESEPHPHLKVQEWAERVQVDETLPELPLFLRMDQQWVMVDLEQTYQATLRAGRYQPSS